MSLVARWYALQLIGAQATPAILLCLAFEADTFEMDFHIGNFLLANQHFSPTFIPRLKG